MLKLHNPRTGRSGFFRCWPEGDQWRLYGETGTLEDGTCLNERHPSRQALEARLEDLIPRFEAAGYVASGTPFEKTPPPFPLPPVRMN